MITQSTPATRTPRPHRIMVNVDADTAHSLRLLAFAGETSISHVAAEALRLLVPTIRPVVEAMAQLRVAPVAAMEKLSLHADAVAQMADKMVDDLRMAQRAAGRPPSSNTGG